MKILLVEDDKMHLAYLKDQIDNCFGNEVQVHLARNGREAEERALSADILAIVMDLRMRDQNGIDAARIIWGRRPETRILFWSNYSDQAYLRGISKIVPTEAAYGYVLKTASTDRLALALRAVLVEGQIMIDREVHSLQSTQAQSPNTLTEAEHAILLDLAIGLTDKIIAERRGLSLRTVQNRLITLYEKLEEPVLHVDANDLQMNKRVRTIANAITRGIINPELLTQADKDFRLWTQKTRI